MTPRHIALLGALALAAPAVVAVVAPLAIGSAAMAAPHADKALVAAVDSPARPEADKKRDVYRHPVQTLGFWGVKPGMTVVDLQPGGGYWTAILAPYAAKTGGHYIAGGGLKAKDDFLKKYGDKAQYGEIGYVEFGRTSAPFAAPDTVDLIITSREIHNWMRFDMLDKSMKESFAALKPGGVLAVEEHRADGGPATLKTDGSAGYVKVSDTVAAAEKAGFKLAAKSDVNANPKDTKDHPFGVWTLPPTRQSTADGRSADASFDHAKYDAIGESDRMTLRFVKPKA